MRRALRAGSAVGLALTALLGCDSTVGLDTTRSQFTNILVPGVCQVGSNLDVLEVSTLLLNGPEASLVPSSKLRGQSATVGETLRPQDFTFSHINDAQGLDKLGFIEVAAGGGARTPVSLLPSSVEFAFPGGAAAQSKRRLVVFLMDHSGSLIGEDRTGMVDLARGSDRNDQRITFFSQLLYSLPDPSDHVSLVWFNDLPQILPEYATPTRNRDLIKTGFDQEVQFNERGSTQLGLALRRTYEAVIVPQVDLNPHVILFTDGVEDEDALDLSEAIRTYGEANIPITVINLQPRPSADLPMGRRPKLRDLACQTGGDYIFIENAEQFTVSRTLLPMVRNRLVGAWKLRVGTDLEVVSGGASELLLSTVLSARVGESQHSFPLERTLGLEDTRLWLFK